MGAPSLPFATQRRRLREQSFAILSGRTCQRCTHVLRPSARVPSSSRDDCNKRIDEIVRAIPTYGLNLALIDPFGVSALHFEVIKRLAAFARMDILLHFPTNTIKRNLHEPKFHDRVDQFFGTKAWRGRITEASDVVQLIDVLREQLRPLSYTDVKLNSMPIKNDMNNVLYHLVFASKHDKGDAIWQSVTRTDAKGQRSMF